jgi:regulator of sirC expression with transglutaminase-like and TPR domain
VGATDRFVALLEQPEADVPLDEACLLVAAHAHEEDDADRVVDDGLLAIDRLAAGCRGSTLEDVITHLFGDVGFKGNRRHYDEPENSYLDVVLDRRTGIPITLSIVTIETARRVGVSLVPVGMPGHFLVGASNGVYVDAFDGGRLLDRAACRQKLEEVAGASVAWSDDLLAPIGTHAVLARVLANLRQVFLGRQDLAALDWVLALRAAIPGAPDRDHLERSAVLAALGDYPRAAGVLERLAAGREGAERKELEGEARRLRARLN